MPIEVRMPRLTDSMTEGVVVAWRKRVGEPVRAGEIIAEIQADKTTIDLESPGDGSIGEILTPAGAEAVPVDHVLAILHTPAEAAVSTTHGVGAEPRAEARSGPVIADKPPPLAVVATAFTPEDRPAPAVAPADVDASPLARSMAEQAGIDLSRLGRNGHARRITMADVLAGLGVEPAPENAEPGSTASMAKPATETFETGAPHVEVPHSVVRQVIARRLSAAKRTVPHFYLTSHCEIDRLLELKAELQTRIKVDLKLTINDFLVRATALALRAVPEANASWTGTAMRHYGRVDVAFAVATATGLITPVIRDAGRKGLAEIASEARDLAGRARAGRLRPEEYQGGTFTISNLGMHDVDEICAIINPPHAGILGIGKAGPRPVVREGAVVVATMMTCTLSADHRVVDGTLGAKFLSTFKSLVERPTTMIL
jgi:pyruvate dehydrogenase E2 component (dihydrolipoamide acetyltransferase)